MKRIFKNYKSSIVLLSSMIIGFLIGIIFKEKAIYLNPLGTLFINLLSTIIVPFIFVTITLAIAKIRPQKVFKILKNILITFVIFSLAAVITGIISTKVYRFVNANNNITLSESKIVNEDNTTFLEKTTSLISVDDFNKLLTKNNMIALIMVSIITGIAIYKSKEKGIIKAFESIQNVLMIILNIIMYYAPIGIAAFFASMVGTLGSSIAIDYVKVFIYYTIISILFASLFYSLIAFICKKNIKTFWKESIPVILCSLSTCSSASCLPINVKCISKLGVSDEVSKTTTSLGTSFHKDGSIIDGVFKIMFLVYLFNSNVPVMKILCVSILSSILISAVPVGGGTISEMLILSLLGFPLAALPILTIIATITDAPATMLNSLGDTSACILVDHFMKKDAKS